MPAEVTETQDPAELLGQFKERYQNLLGENQQLAKKIKDNEQTALKPVSYTHLTLPTKA